MGKKEEQINKLSKQFQGSKKKARHKAFHDRRVERMVEEWKKVLHKRQLDDAIEKGNIPLIAKLVAEEE